MKRTYIASILCLLILTGCATGKRYELSKDSAGRLVRLDTRSGEVMLIEGDRLVPLQGTAPTTPQSDLQALEDEQLPQVSPPAGGKTWPILSMRELGDVSAALTSYWEDGKLHYLLELYPWSKRLKLVNSGYYTNASFSLRVHDAAGKEVARIELPAEQLVRVINNSRNVEELSTEGELSMTKEDYDSLAGWKLLWNP